MDDDFELCLTTEDYSKMVQAQKEQHQSEKQTLNLQNQQLKAVISQKSAQISQLIEQNTAAKAEGTKYSLQVTKMAREKEDFVRKIQNMAKQKTDLSKILEESEKNTKTLDHKYRQITTEKEQLTVQLKKLKDQLASSINDKEDVAKKLALLTERHQLYVADFKTKMDLNSNQKDSLREQIEQMQAEIDVMAKEIERLNTTICDREQTISGLKKAVEDLTQKLEALKAQLTTQQTSFKLAKAQTQQELDRALKSIAQYSVQLKKQHRLSGQLEREIVEGREKLQQSLKGREELQKQLIGKVKQAQQCLDERKRLQALLSQKEIQISQSQQKCSFIESHYAQKNKQLDMLLKEIQSCKAEIQTLSRQKKASALQLDELRVQLQTTYRMSQQLRKAYAQKNEEFIKLQRTFQQKLENKDAEILQAAMKSQQTITQLKQELESSKASLKVTYQMLEKETKKSDVLKAALKESQQELSNLKASQLDQSKGEVRRSQLLLNVLKHYQGDEKQLRYVTNELESVFKQHEQLDLNLENIFQELEDCRKRLSSREATTNNNNSLNNEVALLREQNRQLEKDKNNLYEHLQLMEHDRDLKMFELRRKLSAANTDREMLQLRIENKEEYVHYYVSSLVEGLEKSGDFEKYEIQEVINSDIDEFISLLKSKKSHN